MIKIKRIYEKPVPEDGYRMLVDRLWPRGVRQSEAALDEWNKDIAPSTALRKWFGHKPELFDEFVSRYTEELNAKKENLFRIKGLGENGLLTLLYAARDERMNPAAVLLQIINDIEK
ncbi:Uncharacterized conserved protein YeaO, DUF488 family [Sphingobacterium nematocida]|uniref:Uncharacterized conserved protein YeaO, DUF488 family n=1 Tax=Sphingobacterium nematocida TaxID=1513896 RepID=A0A1T5G7X5_9SPHI|nr:DUF488 domain-containing protein [Sphingobacterium nematocida]SKC04474.1 Uncharacterized conserved protein YeaO, DUF488 family [Sphingobacterium nematocida]